MICPPLPHPRPTPATLTGCVELLAESKPAYFHRNVPPPKLSN
jgi:hypothetical protein